MCCTAGAVSAHRLTGMWRSGNMQNKRGSAYLQSLSRRLPHRSGFTVPTGFLQLTSACTGALLSPLPLCCFSFFSFQQNMPRKYTQRIPTVREEEAPPAKTYGSSSLLLLLFLLLLLLFTWCSHTVQQRARFVYGEGGFKKTSGRPL